ncbi:tRNA(Ile)-lysidine synthetase [Paucilactobacillus oligofermentans DSM 15707 = LMG 22743]|uniref:tRNA(Ile)-lysidine synthase n=1 Tax=Paucilactobacillus oligofermentans DSM 15707 = LMG 22743 TaxID=1423778 RepID=A0A0R1RYA6_9LACO|nr:tRNA lysidine(34) synthetase TilS [Paucilactobacillus oligofermentans]KRL58139.1 tRNA(Ile)-lysidine synthetase [Paucilactobacillus oligofermentans DSM 15707 = LMG 22743]CUS26840.1 tRNA(Ile)-lysidine synthase [Paucilactobacillus oligofermentans DSM 15707 = LMG 22743]
MNNLQTKFERDLSQDRFFYSNEKVIVAVSTGSDSMALLSLLINLPIAQQPNIIVAHVNHELRLQSQEEEQFLKGFCQAHHLTLEVKHWPLDDHPTSGMEAAARQFRYDFFESLMLKYDARKLLTAHHLNDQAETILMKLTRGGELTTLSGMQQRREFGSGELIRPLLKYRKADLREYLAAEQLTYYDDETNQALEFSRNRYRQQILPLLMNENDEALEHLESFATQLNELAAFADLKLAQMWHQVQAADDLNLTKLAEYTVLEQKQLIKYWLIKQQQVTEIKEQQLTAIMKMIHSETPQAQLTLGQGFIFIKQYQAAKVTRELSQKLCDLEIEDYVSDDDHEAASVMWLPKSVLPLRVRLVKLDDEIRLKDGHHQKVRRILIDQKVPNDERQQQVVVVTNDDEPIWVVNRKFTYLQRPVDYQSNWQKVYFMPQLSNHIKGD